MYEDEKKHFEETDENNKTNHIFVKLERLKTFYKEE